MTKEELEKINDERFKAELRNCTGWNMTLMQKKLIDQALEELRKILLETIKPKKG